MSAQPQAITQGARPPPVGGATAHVKNHAVGKSVFSVRRVWQGAALACAMSVLVVGVYLQRQERKAMRIAEREISTALSVAIEDYTFVSTQITNASRESRKQMTDRLNRIGSRVQRLTGMDAIFIDSLGNSLVPARNATTDNLLLPVLARAQAGAFNTLSLVNSPAALSPYLMMVRELPASDATADNMELRYVAVFAPEDETLESFHDSRRNAILACAAFMAMLSMLAWIFSRYLLRRDAYDAAAVEREKMLAAHRAQLEETYRIAQIGHFYWDLATDALELYGHGDSVYGYSPAQHFKTMREWQEKFCPSDDWTPANDNRREFIERGEAYAVQRRTMTPDGKLRWLDISAEPVKDASGIAIAYRGAFRDITAQKIAEQQLTESEEKFRLISENMHDHVALHSSDGTILYATASTKSLLGYDAAGAVGKSPYRDVHPEDLLRVTRALEELAGTPSMSSTSTEYRYRHRDGHYLWLHTIIVPVRDAVGALLYFQASTRDVTERRNAEEQLRCSEERFRALTAISSDWYWETDEFHRFSFLSLQQTLFTNQPQDEILGKTRRELFPDALKPQEWVSHQQTLDARRPFQGLVIRIHESGDRGPVGYFSLSGRPMHASDGRFVGYRGTGRDITRVKVNEQQLAESEERYRLITQNMRDLISLHKADGKLLYVSPSFRTITGHDLWAIIGVSARYLLHPADSVWVRRRYVQLLAGRDVPSRITYRLRHRDGHYLWLETQITLVRAADGSLLHVQAASRDVTARREAEIAVELKTQELAKANKLLAVEVRERQELERNILMTIEMELAQVGLELHDELGQDLTGIALMSKSLERRLAEKGWSESADATRISELVNRTIGHTRMISHGLSPYIWGSDGLVAALSQLASDINSLGVVECSTMLDSNIAIHDEIVARSLYRIAQESINNALKHSRAQNLTLSLAGLNEGIELTISDDGIGHQATDVHLESGGRFHSIRHRCSAINATVAVSHRKRGGTVVKVMWHAQPAPAAQTSQPESVLP